MEEQRRQAQANALEGCGIDGVAVTIRLRFNDRPPWLLTGISRSSTVCQIGSKPGS